MQSRYFKIYFFKINKPYLIHLILFISKLSFNLFLVNLIEMIYNSHNFNADDNENSQPNELKNHSHKKRPKSNTIKTYYVATKPNSLTVQSSPSSETKSSSIISNETSTKFSYLSLKFYFFIYFLYNFLCY